VNILSAKTTEGKLRYRGRKSKLINMRRTLKFILPAVNIREETNREKNKKNKSEEKFEEHFIEITHCLSICFFVFSTTTYPQLTFPRVTLGRFGSM